MSFTPNKTGIISTNTVRTSGGISKTLLTPCRRVGLSRKSKTPLSDAKNTSIKNIVATINNNNSSENHQVTPLNHKKIAKDSLSKSANDKVKNDVEICVSNKPKRKTKKCLIMNDDEVILKSAETKENVDENKTIINDIKNSLPINEKQSAVANVTDTSPINSEDEDFVPMNKNKKFKRCISSFGESSNVSCNAENSDSQNNVVIPNKNISTLRKSKLLKESDSEDDDFIPAKRKNKLKNVILSDASNVSSNFEQKKESCEDLRKVDLKKPSKDNNKTNKRRLSMKKSTCSDTLNFDSDIDFLPEYTSSQKSNSLNECFVQLETLPLLHEAETNSKLSDSEDIEYPQEIAIIEARIKEKEEILAKLKQAEVYQKMHNVEKLNAERDQWKQGCKDALNTLLPLLQDHGNIDMETLLKNLQIPPNMVRCNSDGDLS